MRATAGILLSVLAIAAAGCSPRQAAAPPVPAAPSPPAAPAAPIEPAPPAEPQAPPAPEPSPAPAAPPAPPAPVRFSPADYGAQERRIHALINNAESRDTLGETQAIAEQSHAQRQHCTTRACILQSYAAEEAWLRKWEGSSDIR